VRSGSGRRGEEFESGGGGLQKRKKFEKIEGPVGFCSHSRSKTCAGPKFCLAGGCDSERQAHTRGKAVCGPILAGEAAGFGGLEAKSRRRAEFRRFSSSGRQSWHNFEDFRGSEAGFGRILAKNRLKTGVFGKILHKTAPSRGSDFGGLTPKKF